MEAPPMGGTETERLEDAKLTSAAAFVEGGIQEACDDACSICLEEFCDSDPSTVTGCKHEFHLHCILEWCQRSSQCPMCWQPISLKDSTSQELLDAVVQERNLRLNPPRNAPIFHHPTLGDFGIQHLPVGVNNAELEERIIQHFAAAAEMGRTRHLSRREGHRNRSTNHVRPHFLVFSTQPHAHAGQASPARGESEPHLIISGSSPSSPVMIGEQSVHISAQSNLVSSPESSVPTNQHGMQLSRRPPSQTPNNQERTGPSDLHSFSEALRSRLSAMSIRYKESISKSTRGWKERWFSRNSPTAELGSQVSREVNPGITSVSRTMAHVERRENGSGFDSAPSGSDVRAVSGPSVEQRSDPAIDSSGHHTEVSDSGGSHIRELYMQTPFAASSGSS